MEDLCSGTVPSFETVLMNSDNFIPKLLSSFEPLLHFPLEKINGSMPELIFYARQIFVRATTGEDDLVLNCSTCVGPNSGWIKLGDGVPRIPGSKGGKSPFDLILSG